jgi:hypothetical protein
MKKTCVLKPSMTPATLTLTPALDKPAEVRSVPPRQPLPRPGLDPSKPALKLGLDVHLDLIMAVGQRDHASAYAWRKFRRKALHETVRPIGKAGFLLATL